MVSTETKRLVLIQKLAAIENEQILDQIGEILEADDRFEPTEWQKEELDRRYKRHLAGESKSYTWEEVETKIRQEYGR